MTGPYCHLGLVERELLSRMKIGKIPVGQMAARLGQHPSTIYRELRRNYFFDEDAYFRCYFGSVAHDKARRHCQGGGKVMHALRKGQAALFQYGGGIMGEVRLIERRFNVYTA
jgi:IS30 family transposase